LCDSVLIPLSFAYFDDVIEVDDTVAQRLHSSDALKFTGGQK